VAAALAAGETLAIADVTDDPRVEAHHAAQFAPLRRRANLAAPMLREGRWVGTISLFGPEPRAWTPGEQVLFRAAAERLWSALETARALREADLERGRLQALLDALPVGVLVADGDGAIVHFSEALARIMRGTRLVGSAEEYAHYRAWWTASGEPLRPEEWGLARALRDGTTSVGELIDVERLDGTRATILNAAAPVRDAAGQVVGAVAAVLDVTDQRRLEERLRHAQKLEAVGQLAGGIAHDFNNLLTVIKGNLEFVQEALEDELPGGHPVLDDLEQIARSAERTRTLVRQLLAFSRRQQLRLQRVRVDALVTEAERLLRRVLGEDIVLAVHVEGTPAVVLADPGQLEQVLMNLAVNARDAMRTPAHGHAGTGGMLALEVDATALGADEAAGWDDVAPGRYVRLVVRDTGHGMDAATRARAFEPFFTTKPVGVGTGLGLATVHGIVRQAGGAIRVDSAPGAGTTFTILLPAAEEPDADDEPDARAPIG
jgi:PAS domain S-box-containing protein